MKYGIGRWVQILDTGLLPGKLIQQLNGQTQRLLGQQSLAGLSVHPILANARVTAAIARAIALAVAPALWQSIVALRCYDGVQIQHERYKAFIALFGKSDLRVPNSCYFMQHILASMWT